MTIVSSVLVALIAVLHLYIMWFEMFKWQTKGPKIFNSLAADLFAPTQAMAANQGLYNGFLAAGLLWSLLINDANWQSNVALCFLLFVFTAGVFGAITVSKKIIFVQAVPAALAILSLAF